MRNIKLQLEYDGGRYQGWTRLGKDESSATVSGKLLDVICKMTQERDITLFCGCRTEAGVHAYAQVVNFKTSCSMTTTQMQYYFNRYLPGDIAVTLVCEVPERFHAQLNAKAKTYVYKIAVGNAPSVFERRYMYHCYKVPDKKRMELAAKRLLGTHDFKNFSSVKKSKSTSRTVTAIDIYSMAGEMQITITANDFLHNMARLMISFLLDVGLGNKRPEDCDAIFSGTLSCGDACDPKGLFLQEISY